MKKAIGFVFIALVLATYAVAGEPMQLTTYGNNQDVGWSRDGDNLVYCKTGNIWTIKADGSGEKQISFMPNGRGAWAPTFRPGTDRVYYLDNSPTGADYWWVVWTNKDGSAGRNKVLMVPGGEAFSNIFFSEKGDRVVYVHEGYNEQRIRGAKRQIKISKADGSGTVAVIRDDTIERGGGVSWGKGELADTLFFVKKVLNINCIFSIKTNGTGQKQLTFPDFGNCVITDFSSGKLLFSKDNHVFSLNSLTEEMIQLTDDAFENTWGSLSPNGSKLAYASKRGQENQIFIVDNPGEVCTEDFSMNDHIEDQTKRYDFTLGNSSDIPDDFKLRSLSISYISHSQSMSNYRLNTVNFRLLNSEGSVIGEKSVSFPSESTWGTPIPGGSHDLVLDLSEDFSVAPGDQVSLEVTTQRGDYRCYISEIHVQSCWNEEPEEHEGCIEYNGNYLYNIKVIYGNLGLNFNLQKYGSGLFRIVPSSFRIIPSSQATIKVERNLDIKGLCVKYGDDFYTADLTYRFGYWQLTLY